jgi:hypothetical protein
MKYEDLRRDLSSLLEEHSEVIRRQRSSSRGGEYIFLGNKKYRIQENPETKEKGYLH